MKTLRRVCAAMMLCLTLAVSVWAGDIDSPGKASNGNGTTSVSATVILTIISLIYR